MVIIFAIFFVIIYLFFYFLKTYRIKQTSISPFIIHMLKEMEIYQYILRTIIFKKHEQLEIFYFAFINLYLVSFLNENIFKLFSSFNNFTVEIKQGSIDILLALYKQLFDLKNLDKYYSFHDFNLTLKIYINSYYI